MTLLRLCNGCHRTYDPRVGHHHGGTCSACSKTRVRGYDHRHRRLAKQTIAQHPYCVDCGTTTDLCADHIVPASQGGTNTPDNYTVRCRPCNTARRNRDPRLFGTGTQMTRLANGERESQKRL